MQIRFLLGPAGSGKTFRCLAEIRDALRASPDGPPLILLAPKQATFQLERQLLSDETLCGYTRLHILSFERLANFIFAQLKKSPPRILDEEGRLMVLRSLLTQKRDELKLFRASARLAGFAQQLSLVIRELQQNQFTSESLRNLATELRANESLSFKLHDLATLLEHYLNWLQAHDLQDANCLLDAAAKALREQSVINHQLLTINHLWLDGFAEFSPQELNLLATLIPHCEKATLAFCLDKPQSENISWLSHWSIVRNTFEQCEKQLSELRNCDIEIETLPRDPTKTRFTKNPSLAYLEAHWQTLMPLETPPGLGLRQSSAAFDDPRDCGDSAKRQRTGALQDAIARSIRLVSCSTPEAEAIFAAREILRHVRNGGRFRETAILVRKLDDYHEPLQRIFSRYGIPFFLDRRESVHHHPLAELTRSALRTVAYGWAHDDWFAALKTGFVRVNESEIDSLENEALARGWKGSVWTQPIQISESLEKLRKRVVAPFQRLATQLAAKQNRPTGEQLADALREFWSALGVEHLLEKWASEAANPDLQIPNFVHATVWGEMNGWLENVALAFPREALSLPEWLPILEAGLANLTVGVIPPALDQVLIGAIDRSRNPELKLALVLGMNEGVFPAAPDSPVLITDADRDELSARGATLGASLRERLARERYFGYIACTRSSERLALTYSQQDADGKPLNPSPFIAQIREIFPKLETEDFSDKIVPHDAEHPTELAATLVALERRTPFRRDSHSQTEAVISENQPQTIPPLRSLGGRGEGRGEVRVGALISGQDENSILAETVFGAPLAGLLELPAIARLNESLTQLKNPDPTERLSAQLAERLYGATLRTSVSKLEEFAACPFRFFVHSGLRAEERKLFELDSREQGSFQHDALKLFHEQLVKEGKRWRDVTPQEARERIGQIAKALAADYRDGLLQNSAQARFTARIMIESLQDFIEVIVTWMRGQYEFDPAKVELEFGGDNGPACEFVLGDGHKLALKGRIDRVDVFREPGSDEASCVVLDYKSSQKTLDSVLVGNGIQLQLLTYLNVLRRLKNSHELFGAKKLLPAGVFYVNLRGKYEKQKSRADALAEVADARKLAYRHAGRFDFSFISRLDKAGARDQFNYRRNKDGSLRAGSAEALTGGQFEKLLSQTESLLLDMGRRIFSGETEVNPYRKGTTTACDYCDYRSVCRIDPWTHQYRVLKKNEEANEE